MTNLLRREIAYPALLLSFLMGFAISAQGHDPGLSSLTAVVMDRQIDLVLGLAVKDAETVAAEMSNGTPSTQDFAAIKPVLESLVSRSITVYFGNELAEVRQAAAQQVDSQNIEVKIKYARGTASRLHLVSGVIAELPFGHRQFLTVRTETGAVLAQSMLSAQDNSFSLDVPSTEPTYSAASQGNPFFPFLILGIEHILTGYDHLLFLFGLLVVCRDVRSILTVISCFTVAHSITLALAALDIVRLPGRVVEPLIAASIAYVGIENLLRGGSPRWRWLITFVFGLVHGLGFADALREFGIGTPGIGIFFPLVGFNLGVEVGQLSVAAIVLPMLWQLRRLPIFVRRGVPVCSVLIALAGSYWVVERVAQV